MAAGAGDDHRLVLDGGDALADPCSRFQPEGVRGPSRIVDPAAWTWTGGGWPGLDPEALVDAAHAQGLGVILDMVYNHVGPGSETLEAFGPYLTERHGTPWGRAVDSDDADCGGVRDGCHADFGRVSDLAEAAVRPFVHDGRYSGHRRRRHGAPTDGLPPRRFVVCSQNHDQVGDRPPSPARALAAMWVILSPYVPLLFMGEEHGEERPFQFFTDMRELYRALFALRRELPDAEPRVRHDEAGGWICLEWGPVEVVGNFGRDDAQVPVEADGVVLATDAGVTLREGRLRLPAPAGAVVR